MIVADHFHICQLRQRFDRWNVVNYLRVLQGVVPTPAQSEAVIPEDDPDTMSDQMEGASSHGDGATSK